MSTDDLDQLQWTPPPPAPQRLHITKDFVAELRLRPGEWAKYPRSLANQHERQYWGTEWEFRERDDGRYDAWARWVGR